MSIGSDALIAAGVGILTLVIGYLIKFQGWTFLVAGYDRSTSLDGDLVGDIVGSMLLRVGLAVIVFAGLTAFGTVTRLLEAIFAAVVVIEAGRTIYRVNTTARV